MWRLVHHGAFLLWLESAVRDVRLAVRACRRSPAFSVSAILTLALGIGANAAVFRVLDAVALRSLPVRDARSLVRLQLLRDGKPSSFNYPLFAEMASRQQSLEGMLATVDVPGAQIAPAGSEPTTEAAARLATGNFFRLLGVEARVGRAFDGRDDQPTASPVAVLGYGFWRRAFGGRPDIVGQILRVNNVPITIVGVMPAAFSGEQIGSSPDVWLPMSLATQLSVGWLLDPGSSFLSPMGRLRADTPPERARLALNALYRQVGAQEIKIKGVKAGSLEVLPGAQGVRGASERLSSLLWMLMGIVGLVVLIACCNLASLLLARAASRAQEVGVRVALGASRTRVIRQMLTESLLLASAGALIGVGVSAWASRELVRVITAGEPWRLDLGSDWRVVAFAVLLAIVTVLLFGLPSALKATRGQPSLHTGLRTVAGSSSSRRAAKGFLVAQVACSLVLVAGAFLLGRSFWNLAHQDFGYRRDGVLLVRLPFDLANFKVTRDPAFCDTVERSMGALPGVRSVALAGAGPLGAMQRPGKIALVTRPAAPGDEARFVSVSPRYFETMGIPIVAGRSIADADRRGSARVAVISETAARRIFGRRNPLGLAFSNADRFNPEQSIEVVGIARDLRFNDPRDPFGIVVFVPLQQSPAPLTSVVLKTAGDPGRLAKAAEQRLRQAAPGLKITDAVPLAQVLDLSLAKERMMATLTAALGVLAILLASVGLYGLTAYGIAQRTREIGIRLALGANQGRVLGEILREVITLLSVGLIVGTAASLALGRMIAAFLFGLTPHDPFTLFLAAVSLAGVALLAGCLAARRALAVDPMCALRES